MPYILKAEGLTLSINNGIARDSIPAVGQIVISDVIEEPLPRGFSGRVLSVEETSEAYIITCEAVALTDIFERLLIVGRSESFTPEEIQQARRKASPDDTDWDGVVPFEFPKFSLNIPSVEGFVSNSKSDMTLGTISITPKFYVSYIADIRPFVHSYVKVLFENKSKVATEMHLKVSGESPVTETKRASVYLAKVPIPLVTGVLYGEVAVSGDLYLKGNLDLKASFSNNIYNGDEYEWSTSDFWNITHTRYDKDPKKAKKGDDDNDNQWQSEVTLSVNGSFGFGASLDLVLFAVSENTLEISNTTTVGPELSGSLQFSSEGLKDGTLYSTLKNTNVTFTPLKLSDDVKFNICNREFTLGSFSHSFGSKQFKLFPDFEPLSLLKKYTPGDYSQLPLGIYTKVTNDVIPIIPLKLGIGRYDQYDNLLEESFAPDFYQYADEWDNKKLYFDMSSLPAGESYTFHPLIRIWGLKALQLKAMPQTVISVPEPMTLEQDAVVLQKFKTRLVAINGGWGDYSTSTSSRLICTSEIVNNNGKPYVKIATLRSFGSATVTVKDLRSGETKTILVTVSNDAVPEEFTLSEQTVSLQEDESTTVLVTSGSGNYTAESSNENVATATVEDDMITITAISIGSATITVTDTETEETATIEVTVKEAGGGVDIFEVDLPPSTTLSPEIQWEADIMVFNNGERYNSNYLNQVIGTPPSDTNGNKWYAQNYQLTNSEKTWNVGKSPFSSDATYSGKPSTQWTTDGIMADIYLRRTFTVDHELSDKILFSCCHDDAPAEWYLNGVLIRSIDDGWNYDDKVYLTPEQCALIHTDGTKNVLAIHVHNNWGGAFADGGLYDEGKIPVEIGLPPSTTVSPDVQWKADMMVFNGERYASDVDPLYSYSNQLIGTPPSDAQGNEWYARNYQLTDGEKSWGVGRSPFYSYATYKGKPSTQWTPDWYMADIYLRRYFVVDHELSDKIMFSCSHDDAPAEWYLNGVLIRSIEDGCAHHDEDYDSWTEDESTYLTPEQRALIYTDGRVNVLAIHVHNNWGVGFADGGFYEVP